MKVLITGGAGFIGSNFIRYWSANYPNDEIINLDKITYAVNPKTIEDLANIPSYTLIEGDVCDRDLVYDIVKDVDLIVHFAAESHVDRSIEGPYPFVNTNVLGTLTLLEAAREFNVRFHHISTDEVFGDLPSDKPEVKFNEYSKIDPRNPYSASKASAEHFVRVYFETHKVPITISNCSNNFGPYHYPEKLIPLFTLRAIRNKELPVYGDGLQIRDWIHTEDHCKGIDLIVKKGRIGESYLLGGDGERTNLQVVREILKILNKSENLIVHVGDRKGHDRRYAIDYSKAKTELGFEPSKNFEERLKETVEWYLDNNYWWEDLITEVDKTAEKYLSKRL